MFNVFKKEKSKYNKLKLNENVVTGFLEGSYEKHAKFTGKHVDPRNGKTIRANLFKGELEGIRSIKASWRNNDVDIVFAKDYRDKFGARIIHKNGLQPFLWSKTLKASNFYTHNIVSVDDKDVSNGYVLLPNGEVRKIDKKSARLLNSVEENGKIKHWIRYKIKSKKEWEELLDQKRRLYGIIPDSQIQSFDGNIVDRMKNGFKTKITINRNEDKPKYSGNPYFSHPKYNKIVGSFSNLLDFYKEGGIAPRGTLYLNEDKLYSWYNFLSLDKEALVRWYIHLYRWRKLFNPFVKESCDFNKIIGFYKTIYPKIKKEVNKTFINKLIDDEPDKIVDLLLEHNKDLDTYFNIKLDENKIIRYIVEPYTFDSNRDSKDLVDYLDSLDINLYDKLESQLFYVNPLEQYMIQTGRRLFKGIENYEDLNVLTVDIETKPLEGNEHIDIAALKPELGRIFQVGIGDNKGFKRFLHAKEEHEEQAIIEKTFQTIAEQDPDLLLTYNGEGFDYPFMEKRLELLGCVAEGRRDEFTSAQYIRNLMEPYYEEYGDLWSFYLYRRNDKAILKVGNTTEDYTQTMMFGKNICDVMFAVKRAAAIDTSLPNNKLKDNIIHANLAAKDRVYMDGQKIGFYESDDRDYYLNESNGEYFLAEKSLNFFEEEYSVDLVKKGEHNKYYKTKKYLFLYTDDGTTKYDFLKECENAVGIPIHNNDKLLSDANLFTARQLIDDCFTGFYQRSLKYEGVYCPLKGIANQLKKVGSTGVYNYIIGKLKMIRSMFKDVKSIHEALNKDDYDWSNIKRVDGSYLVNRYLEGDIEEPYLLDKLYSQATFAISKWLPTKYQKIATMGNANVWKLLLAAWSYLNCIAIPEYEEPREFTGGLLGMVAAGYHKNIVKIDYSSLYPAEALAHCEEPDIDITGIYKMLLRVSLDQRLNYKKLKNNAKSLAKKTAKLISELKSKENLDKGSKKKLKELEIKLEQAQHDEREYDKKQLPLKILINSFYGMLGAPMVSPFCHIDTAWHITCSGRQHMRHLIRYFQPRGFKIIYFHTDGANFVIPENVEDYKYIGKGENWLVEKGKKYTGVEAYVAEYNDLFMKGRMGVDIDEYALSCINFSKGNFSYLKEKDGKLKISHVGGTLSKKNQNQYIKDFFDENLETLFLGEGSEFVDSYYNYIKKIYNQEIVAGKIANKNKVKKSIDDYLRGVKDGTYVKQAHMELAVLNDLQVEVGDWLFTLNDGDGKKDIGDLKTVNDCIGYFTLESESLAKLAMQKLNRNKEDFDYIVDAMLKAERNNQFVFKKERVPVVDLFGNTESSQLVTKKRRINEIADIDKVKFKYRKKKTKKHGIEYTIEVYYVHTDLNARLVERDDLDARLPYNSIKYIEKFNKAMENIWIVFHPDVREKIPTPNSKQRTGEDYNRKPNQRGWFTDEELALTSGYPLKGKEDKQQDLDELLVVTDEEMDFWLHMGLSPNNSFDNQVVNVNANYDISWKDDVLYIKEITEDDYKIMGKVWNGRELIYKLKDMVILDYDNPPYKFVK